MRATNAARPTCDSGLPAADAVLVDDLASRTKTLSLACRANELGTFDAVIHNAGIGYRESRRIATP
jgi:hypothetical protein